MDAKEHDILIELRVILTELKRDFENHLQDHKKYLYLAWSTTIGVVVVLAICLIKLV